MRSKLTIGLIGVIIGVLLSTVMGVLAGTPSGPGTAPGATNSYTLADIYHSLDRGVAATPSTFTGPVSGPETGTMYTLDEIYALTRLRAPVPKTGQTGCWNTGGTSIVCPGTGHDGEYQKGVAWPNPRFTDNGDGTATDNLTGLIWLKNANCYGAQVWDNAILSTKTLNSGECGLSDGSLEGDWRLPNVRELHSLIDYGNYRPALPDNHPFTTVQSSFYWSSTTGAYNTSNAWFVSLNSGNVNGDFKTPTYYVWPVRGGQ